MTTDQNRDLRDDLLHALDHAYVVGPLGFDTPEALLAAYDASRAVPVPPPADQTALREKLADAVRDAACPGDCGNTEEECARERIQPFAWHHGRLAIVEGTPEQFADAVMAVLPEQTDRAAVLLEAANTLAALGPEDSRVSGPKAWSEAVEVLRRVAAEEQPARSDVGTEFVQQADRIDGAALAAVEEALTPHCDFCKRPGHSFEDCPDAELPAVGEQHETQEAPVLPCNYWTHTRTEHTPHRWEPQPGMDPVHCPGFGPE